MSSGVPLIRNLTFIFLGFALVFPSLSHLLKLALSKRYLPLFHYILRDNFVGSFKNIPLLYRAMGGVPSTPSYYGTQTGSQGSPYPFDDVAITI